MVAACVEKTYPETTIADVVSRAAVSRTTFYKLFNDKRDFFDAAVTQCIDRIAATMAAAVSGYDSPAEATRHGAVAALKPLAAEPEPARPERRRGWRRSESAAARERADGDDTLPQQAPGRSLS